MYGLRVIIGIIVEKIDIKRKEEVGVVGGVNKDFKNMIIEKEIKFYKIIIYFIEDR